MVYLCVRGLRSHPWDSETGKPCEWPPDGIVGARTRQCVTCKRLQRAMEQQRLLNQGSLACECVDCGDKKVPMQMIGKDGIPVCAACRSARERKPQQRAYLRQWRTRRFNAQSIEAALKSRGRR